MALEIQVLAWDRHKMVTFFNFRQSIFQCQLRQKKVTGW
jgi:hypothetical protein